MIFGKTIKLIIPALLTMAAILLLGQTAQARTADAVWGQTVNGSPVFDKAIPNDATPNAFGYNYVYDVLVDEVNHYLFVSDNGFYRIMIYQLDSNNKFTGTDRAADFVLGRSSLTSYATTTADKQLNAPRGLAYDPTRNYLYVADTSNNRVLVYDGSNGWTNNEAPINVYGQTSLTDIAVGGCTQTGLSGPYSVVYNSASDTIFIADEGHDRVLSFPATTSTLSTPATTGNAINVIGQSSFTSCVAPTLTTINTSTLWGPDGLAVNTTTNKLYVADGHAGRVVVYDLNNLADNMPASQVFGKPSMVAYGTGVTQSVFARTAGSLTVTDVEIDTASNTLYVVDYSSRIMVFDASTTTVAGANAQSVLGQADYVSGTGALTQVGLNKAMGIGFSPSTKYLYVGEYLNVRVQIFDVAEITNGEAAVDGLGQIDGSGNLVYTTNYAHNTAPSAVGTNYPRSLVIDPIHHHLFESEGQLNNRILVFDLDNSNRLTDSTADHVIGQTDFAGTSAATTASGFSSPQQMAFNAASSTLFVADYTNNRVMIFDVSNITTNGMSAINVFGQTDFTSATSGHTTSTLYRPNGVSFDSVNKRLFVTDNLNNRIMVFDTNTTTNGGPAINVLGQTNFTNNTASTNQTGMDNIQQLDYDSASSTLYVAVRGSSRVSIYDLSGGITDGMNTTHVLGQSNFTSSTSGTSATSIYYPFGIKYVPEQKKLFLAEYLNNRVTVYDDSDGWTDGEPAIGVLGQADFVSGGSAVTQSNFYNATGLEYDDINNRLLVSDLFNYRILTFNLITLPTTTFDTGYLGVSFTTSVPTPNNYQETLSYAVNSGSLPTGLSLNTTTGVISGTPSATGTYSFDIRATETGTSGIYYDTQTFSITIDTPTVTLTSASYSASEDALSSPFTLSITTSSAYDISVVFSIGDSTTANSTNYSYITTTATIPAGSTTASVPLSILHNHVVEPNKTVSISISSPTNASLGTITSSALTIVNVDARGGGGDTTTHDPILPSPITVVTPVESVPTTPVSVLAPTTPPLFTPAQVKSTVTAMNKILATKRWPSFGSKGTAVNTVQQVLINLKYLKISKPTGNFLSMTKQAVKRFQKANHISTTGNVGPLTAAAMRKVVSK